MPTTPPSITSSPPAPDRSDRANFSARATAWATWLVAFVSQLVAAITNVYDNAVEAYTSAETATSAAGTATTAAGTATTAAGTASTQAGIATTAANAATTARTAIDNRIYPGTYSADPSTRPDGSALEVGDWYFSSLDGLYRRYNGATWAAADIDTALLAASTGSSMVGHTLGVSGAVTRAVQAFLRGQRVDPALHFGAVGDGSTDSTAALLAWATYLSSLTEVRAAISPGVYLCSSEIQIVSAALKRVDIEAYGAEIVITGAAGSNKRWFRVSNTAQVGELCRIAGLNLRHNRATSRQSGTDMLSPSGFKRYVLEHPVVQSADNMGITVGRGDPDSFASEALTILAPRIGGRYDEGPHSHAPIGDTGIWVIAAPKLTHIIAPSVNGTGDDGILVGHSTSPNARGCYILDADVRDIGANGIVCCVPHGRITGRVDRTNSSGVNIRTLDGTTGEKLRVDVEVTRAGQLQAGDIGTSMIAKVNPFGFWIYKGGDADINLDGSSVKGGYDSGIVLQTQGSTGLRHVHGRMFFSSLGLDAAGVRTGSDMAVVRRSAAGGNNIVCNIRLKCEVQDCSIPLVQWLNSGASDDVQNFLEFDCHVVQVDASFAGTSQALCNFETSGGRAGRVKNTFVRIRGHDMSFGKILRCQGGNSSNDIRYTYEDENGRVDHDGNRFYVGTTLNGAYLRRKEFGAMRTVDWDGASTQDVLCELDPSIPWLIEAFQTGGSTNTAFIGWWDSATGRFMADPAAGASFPLEIVLDAASTRFTEGAVLVRPALSGWAGSGQTLRVKATAFPSGTSSSFS